MNTGSGTENGMQAMGGIPKKRKTIREHTYNARPTKRSKQAVSSPEPFDVRLSPATDTITSNTDSDLLPTTHFSTFAGAHHFVSHAPVYQIAGDYIAIARASSEAGPSNGQPMQGIVQGRQALDPEDLSIEQEIYSGPGYRMHLGQIRQSGRVVSVKVYGGSHAKKRCSNTAKFLIERGVMHPNIPHLIAVSGLKSETPFLVFDGEYEDTVDGMLSWVLKKETKEILTSGLQTVIGLSSGLDYLQVLNYPFASVGLDHFVVLCSKGKIVISFDPEELEPTSELDQELGPPHHKDIAQDFFHELCQRTFNDACKAHYKSRHIRRTYHDEFDADVDEDDLLENPFEEFDDESSSSTAPASSSATTTRPSPRSPNGRRQELVWKSLTTDTVTLKDISRQFRSFLNFHHSSSELALSRRRGRYTARTSHRCPGYSRIEVTLTTDILRSAVVSHVSPTPGEICPVCKEVVEEEILSCFCGNFDDETMPVVRCSACFKWHHRPCVGCFATEKFVCRRCNLSMEFLELDAATLALAAAANAQTSRRAAAAAAASLTIANMVALENGTAFMPLSMPSQAPQPPPAAAAASASKVKKPKGLFKPPTYPPTVLRPDASEPQTPTRSNGDAEGGSSRRLPTPEKQACDRDNNNNNNNRAMSPVSTTSSVSELPLAQKGKMNGAGGHTKPALATAPPAPASALPPGSTPVEAEQPTSAAAAPTSAATATTTATPASPSRTWPPQWLREAFAPPDASDQLEHNFNETLSGVQDISTRLMAHMLGLEVPGVHN